MDRADHEPGDFDRRWLEEQQRFWQAWRARAGTDAAFADAEAAWNGVCDRWWAGVSDGVPTPLAAPLKAALEQSRLCMAMARGLAEGGGHERLLTGAVSPERLFASAADAMRDAHIVHDGPASEEYARAFQALADRLLEVVQASLESIRARLENAGAVSAGEVHEIYAEAIEAHYLEVAGGDDFVGLVGALVNARVDVLAAARSPER